MVGLMRLVVRHEAQRWSRTGGGMPKVALVTIKLHREAPASSAEAAAAPSAAASAAAAAAPTAAPTATAATAPAAVATAPTARAPVLGAFAAFYQSEGMGVWV